MIRPDFRNYRYRSPFLLSLQHSAKGSTWDRHKYVKVIDGVYYYPVGYENGRTIDSLKKDSSEENKEKKSDTIKSKDDKINEVKQHFDQYLAKRGIDWRKLPKEEVDEMQREIIKQLESGKDSGTNEKTAEELAKDVSSGKLGNGEERKALLGDRYEEVQRLLKKVPVSKKVENVKKEEIEATEKVVKKVSSTGIENKAPIRLDEVYSPFRKKKT